MRTRTLPFLRPQPEPIQVLVSRMPMPGGTVTALARLWKPGDTRRCRLCPAGCRADHRNNACLVTVDRDVPNEEAPLLTLRGLGMVRQDAGPRLAGEGGGPC
jgi:hypothetical protein